ncbi:MAG: aromatic amino acid hydroxylase [Bdellovibrionales bacterium]
MQSTIENLPRHLKKYVVDQNYSKYTSEDQAVWRYIMKQLKNYLQVHAHEAYIDGLEKTGITLEQIPKIEDIDKKLKQFNWSAVPISGFIPPAAFMEFQSLGVLPIASDIRTVDHIHYTPAPDIVHESAGHAPILINQDFSNYLRSYATIAKKSIFSKEDLELYDAIRDLSDIKENPRSTPEDIKKCEDRLITVRDSMRYVSEAALLARMNWWTAEYGLIGSLDNPKIFGAGLLSSVGESRSCLQSEVKKIPLTVDCVEYSYDITERQPQLFVAETFETLIDVLEELANSMAFRRGGIFGLNRAKEALTVNTIELGSGLQLSGQLEEYEELEGSPIFLKFKGPCQISLNNKQLDGHGTDFHSQGYSTPLGRIKGLRQSLDKLVLEDIKSLGWTAGKPLKIDYESGFVVEGVLENITEIDTAVKILSFKGCTVKRGDSIYFRPEWGIFDLALAESIPSVFGGPADRELFGDSDDFEAKIIPHRQITTEEKNLHQFYLEIRRARKDLENQSADNKKIQTYIDDFTQHFPEEWLIGIELYEMCILSDFNGNAKNIVLDHLLNLKNTHPHLSTLIEDGIRLAEK